MLLIAACILLSIQFFGQNTNREFRLKSSEMRFFVKKVFVAKTYKEIADSNKAHIGNLNEIIVNDSLALSICDTLLVLKDKTNAMVTKQAEELKSELKSERNRKGFWRILAEVFGIVGGSYIFYDQINK